MTLIINKTPGLFTEKRQTNSFVVWVLHWVEFVPWQLTMVETMTLDVPLELSPEDWLPPDTSLPTVALALAPRLESTDEPALISAGAALEQGIIKYKAMPRRTAAQNLYK